jgi:hypothetical protein
VTAARALQSSSLSVGEFRELARLRANLKPFIETHKFGSLRLDMAEVRLVVLALEAALSSPEQVVGEGSRADP